MRSSDPRRDGRLTVLAHPFRFEGGAAMLDGRLLPDALEYRTPNHGEAAGKSLEASDRSGLPVVNSGDAHRAQYVGRYWIETARPVERAVDIRDIILEGAYTNRVWNENR